MSFWPVECELSTVPAVHGEHMDYGRAFKGRPPRLCLVEASEVLPGRLKGKRRPKDNARTPHLFGHEGTKEPAMTHDIDRPRSLYVGDKYLGSVPQTRNGHSVHDASGKTSAYSAIRPGLQCDCGGRRHARAPSAAMSGQPDTTAAAEPVRARTTARRTFWRGIPCGAPRYATRRSRQPNRRPHRSGPE